jgi:non-lysosomal glucosylceramidase
MRGWKSWLWLGAAALVAAVAGTPAVRAAVDVHTATVTDERLPSGMPLGGIGAGKVELFTDGTFGNLTTNNNWDRPVAQLPASFFALRTRAGNHTDARVLALRSPYRFPTVSSVRFQGDFPRAQLGFEHADLPLDVSLSAQSALIPGNLKDSSLPAASFAFTLANPSAAPVEATLAFSWENVSGRGGTSKAEWTDVTGASQKPQTAGNHTGLVFTTDQKQAGERQNALGQYAVIGEADGGRVVLFPAWDAGGTGADFWDAFTAPAPFQEKDAAKRVAPARPAGVVAVTVTVPANGSAQVRFALGWSFPTFIAADGRDRGHAYTSFFPDAWAAAAYATEYRETLLSGTAEWHDLLLKSSLPGWLKHKLLNDAFPLVSNSVYTKDGQFALLTSPVEGGGTVGGLDQWLLSRSLLASLFPALERSELKLYSDLQAADGSLPRFAGTLDQGFGGPESPTGEKSWPDLACNYILAVYRQYRWTGDLSSLKASYPSVTKAVAWLRTRDADGDGLPEGGSTWDYRTYPGTFSYTAGLYLATLRAAQEIARVNGDKKQVDELESRFHQARDNAMAQLWNGRFLTKYLDPATAERSTDLFAGALAGEWAGQTLGLPALYDRRVADTALRSLLELISDTGTRTPPNELRPDGQPAGPDSAPSWAGPLETYLAALGIARNRADTSLELVRQFAEAGSRSPWDAPLGFDSRSGQRLGPRSHVSTMGSWNAYQAVTGMTLDEPGSWLTVTPGLPTSWNGLHAPVFGPRHWSWIDYARNPYNAATDLRIKLVKKLDDRPVMLNGLTTPAPAGADLDDLTLIVTGPAGSIDGKAELEGGRLVYTFKTPLEWRLGETLDVTAVPPDANNIVLAFDPPRVISYGALVRAKDLSRDRQIKFTLVNPTHERQVVNVRLRGVTDRTYEVFQNGTQLDDKFGVEKESDRYPVVVPSSPIGYERVAVLQETLERLRASHDAAGKAGKLASLQPYYDTLEQKLDAAVRADEAARSTQVLLNPAGVKILGTKIGGKRLKEPPPMIKAEDPEPAVVAAEEALAAVPKQVVSEIQDVAGTSIFLGAIYPVRVQTAAVGEPMPGGTVRLRLSVVNESRQQVRTTLSLQLPEGWEAAPAPRVLLDPGQDGSIEVPLQLPRNLEPKRYTLTGTAQMTAAGIGWLLPVTLRLGHAYVRDWSVIGVWPASDRGLAAALPPDAELDPEKSYEGRKWKVVAAKGSRVDLGGTFGEGASGVAYAVTQVFSPKDQDATLELAADGPVLAKVNGERVFQRDVPPAADGAAERIPIRLRQGWNTLVLKLARAGAPWGFTAEITDRDGATPAGVRVKPDL